MISIPRSSEGLVVRSPAVVHAPICSAFSLQTNTAQRTRHGGLCVRQTSVDGRQGPQQRHFRRAAPALDRHRNEQVVEQEHLASLGPIWQEPNVIFTTAWGNPIHPDTASKSFKRLALKADLGDWHLHELRHSFASLMLAQGVRLEEVSELIGHASIRVTKDVYGHLSGERLREASDKLGEFLGDL
ncbi:MAG: tyrosine-type recombinase/integrase [Ferrimicrobium sp.]